MIAPMLLSGPAEVNSFWVWTESVDTLGLPFLEWFGFQYTFPRIKFFAFCRLGSGDPWGNVKSVRRNGLFL
jgi:hypothetical protein